MSIWRNWLSIWSRAEDQIESGPSRVSQAIDARPGQGAWTPVLFEPDTPVPPASPREAVAPVPEVSAPEAIEFDEEWYLFQNTDVAAAVANGLMKSALAHYLACGRRENRLPLPPPGWVRPRPRNVTTPEIPIVSADESEALKDLYTRHNGAGFLNPSDLSVTNLVPRRVALLGSCQLEGLAFHQRNPSGCPVDLLVTNGVERLPDRPSPDIEISEYDFVFVQIPMRGILPDASLQLLAYDQISAFEDMFDIAVERLRLNLESRMRWNVEHGLLTFVANFLLPQRNIMGALFPKYDLRNPEHFIYRLNRQLETMVRSYRNAYVLDMDRIVASIGRRYVQDDGFDHSSHSSWMGTAGWIHNRIEPIAPTTSHYEITWGEFLREAIWAELITMFRVVRQTDAVKLVVVDLDDTMWHGVSGDITDFGLHMIAGWPIGLVEALSYLKKRGVLLAIISKNEEQRIRAVWSAIFGNLLSLDDFAAVYINWDPKPENMTALLEMVNLLPRNVVYIDDNPAERAAMKQVFPDMRILGRHPYYLRRILLWSSETQVASLTAESSRRTEMIQRQVAREGQRKQLSREDFLRQAAPRVTMLAIDSLDHPRFPRVFELLNKTNQFNTTGRRWTMEEFRTLIDAGATIYSFEVDDTYTNYGLVGVVIASGFTIEQWVMSCRVLGYQIEEAVMSVIVAAMRASGGRAIEGRLIETDVNFPCRTLFSKCGFTNRGEYWRLEAGQNVNLPDHVTLREPENAD